MKCKLEYIWLDGQTPEPALRSKTKIVDVPVASLRLNSVGALAPEWSFDGSSTMQAEGKYSDCVLKPVKVVNDPCQGSENAKLVLCEVWLPDGSPHPSNTRSQLEDADDVWLGFEQEYCLIDPQTSRPVGFPAGGFPEGQGRYYCGVGCGSVVGRDIVERHLDYCLEAGLEITGVNAEVMLGQWEFQVLGKGAREAADALWLARYLLYRVTEQAGVKLEFHPKPVKGDWNGSGLHCNFSDDKMRQGECTDYLDCIYDVFRENHAKHINDYGSSNEERLTGHHETSPIGEFSVGASDRGRSIRIPLATAQNGYGYLEDRRPASNADPYKVAARIVESLKDASALNAQLASV